MKTSILLFLSMVISVNAIVSQDRYQVGLLPSVNINKKISTNTKLNFKIESRQNLEEGRFGEDETEGYDYIHTDFAFLAATKVGFKSTIAGGYQMRWASGASIHRLIQQYSWIDKNSSVRIGHRFSADQTFGSGRDFELRLRYRLTALIPLSGQEVDSKEFYFKVNHEYLNAFEASDYDLEIRLVPLLGYQFSDKSKLEWGFDYRIDSFLNQETRNRLWFALNWYISF